MAIYNSFRKPKIINTDSNIPLSIKKIFRSQMELDISDKTSLSFGDLALINKEKLAIFIDGEYKLINKDNSTSIYNLTEGDNNYELVEFNVGDFLITPATLSTIYLYTVHPKDKGSGAEVYALEGSSTYIVDIINGSYIFNKIGSTNTAPILHYVNSSKTITTKIGDLVKIDIFSGNSVTLTRYKPDGTYVNSSQWSSGNNGLYMVINNYALELINHSIVNVRQSGNIIYPNSVELIRQVSGVIEIKPFISSTSITCSNTNSERTISLGVNLDSGPVKDKFDTKVDKVAGKDLSSNDFSDEYKKKLNDLSPQAGSIIMSESIPNSDFLPANGDLLLKSEYPDLFNSVGYIGELGPSLGHFWKEINSPAISTYSPILKAGGRLFVVSDYGYVSYTDDDENWESISLHDETGVFFTNATARGISNTPDGSILVWIDGLLFKGINNGAPGTWQQISDQSWYNTYKVDEYKDNYPYDICVSGSAILVAGDFYNASGTSGLVKKSIDNGNTWTNIDVGVTYTDNVKIHSSNDGSILYLFDSGVWPRTMLKSVDGGDTWAPYTTLLAKESQIQQINISDDNNWYGIYESFVYRSTDNGQTWSDYIPTYPLVDTPGITFNRPKKMLGYGNVWVMDFQDDGNILITNDNWATRGLLVDVTVNSTSTFWLKIYKDGVFYGVSQNNKLYKSDFQVQYDTFNYFKLPNIEPDGLKNAYIKANNSTPIAVSKSDIELSLVDILARIQELENQVAILSA